MKIASLPLLMLSIVLATAQAATKPNILLIAVDDLKPLLGCYGDPLAKTPSLDRLAARGVVFQRAYCNQAVCAPSRNALMTGLRPTTLGIYDLGTNFRKAAPGAVTLTQHLMAHGWHVQGLGKILHIGHGNTEDAASWSVPHFHEKVIGYALPENNREMTREEALFSNRAATPDMRRGPATETADVPDEAYPDGRIAAEAIRRLQAAAKAGQPFLLAVGFVKPHLPFCAPKKYWDLHDPASFRLAERRTPPDGAPDYAKTNFGELRQYEGMPQKGPVDDATARRLIHGYYAATSYMDAQVGRLLDALDASGQASNTIVVLWGDHGWHLGDHGMWCKHSNYEQAARIPLIIAGPGLAKGTTKALAETVDLYPTLAELAGLKPPAGLDGRSLAPTLRDPAQPTQESVMHCFPRGERIGRALRTARHRLVEWKVPGAPADTAEFELYDYESDPLETLNLAAEKPDLVKELAALLHARHPEAKKQWKPAAEKDAAPAPEKKPKVDRAALFTDRDKNRDGQLTLEEFLAKQPDPGPARERFGLFDTDKNGTLSREEFVSGAKP